MCKGAVKPPLGDVEAWLSTWSWDFGFEVTAQKNWRPNPVIFNLALVMPGDFEPAGTLDPPEQPSANVAWLHRIGYRTTLVIQALFLENILREEVRSDLSRFEFQLTTGVKIHTLCALVGVGFTENLFSYNNTPDSAVHLSQGFLVD